MKYASSLLIFTLCLAITGCKTQEQIRREQMIDNMAMQVGHGQKNAAENSLRLQQLENKLAQLTGKMEELEHDNKEQSQNQSSELKKELKLIQESLADKDKDISDLKASLAEQKKFLDQVLETLSTLSTNSKSSGKDKDKKGSKKKDDEGNGEEEQAAQLSPLEKANQLFQKGDNAEAKDIYLALINKSNKKLKGPDRARIIHNLGMIEYLDKNYSDSVVYFGRLFSEHPGSSLNSNGLFHLGLSFKHLKQHDEAKQTFEELIKRYPKTKSATQAKEVLKNY